MTQDLFGKNAIITGGNQGLGFEIAKKFILGGANVMICARDYDLLQRALEDLLPHKSPKQVIAIHKTNVASPSEVNELIESSLSEMGSIEILVNNAGIYGPMGDIEKNNWEDWVNTIEVNLFGSVLMCRGVLPFFKQKNYGKVIQISGGGATNPMPRLSAYAASKAAVIRFMESFAEEVKDFGIDVNAIAPGALNTRLLGEVLEAGPEYVGPDLYEKSLKQKESGGNSFEPATDLALFLASDKSNGISGKLISAIWDNWHNFPEHQSELSVSDIYTLRRITGRERGYTWGDK